MGHTFSAIAIFMQILMLAFAMPADAASAVDLDKPGALEKLARDRPRHHGKVMEEIAKAQAIHVEPVPAARDARMDDRSRDATTLLPSDPAKKRLTVVVDGIEYRVTAALTKHPAVLEKAR
jgi:hypothetical protein